MRACLRVMTEVRAAMMRQRAPDLLPHDLSAWRTMTWGGTMMTASAMVVPGGTLRMMLVLVRCAAFVITCMNALSFLSLRSTMCMLG